MPTKNINIRKAKISDAKAIAAGFKKAYPPLFVEQNLSQASIDEMLASNSAEQIKNRLKGNYFFVATMNNQIIGVIGLKKDDNSDIHNRISTFFVLSEYRNQKIGSKLFSTVLDFAKSLGVKKLVVNSSLFAEDIYKHCGRHL